MFCFLVANSDRSNRTCSKVSDDDYTKIGSITVGECWCRKERWNGLGISDCVATSHCRRNFWPLYVADGAPRRGEIKGRRNVVMDALLWNCAVLWLMRAELGAFCGRGRCGPEPPAERYVLASCPPYRDSIIGLLARSSNVVYAFSFTNRATCLPW